MPTYLQPMCDAGIDWLLDHPDCVRCVVRGEDPTPEQVERARVDRPDAQATRDADLTYFLRRNPHLGRARAELLVREGVLRRTPQRGQLPPLLCRIARAEEFAHQRELSATVRRIWELLCIPRGSWTRLDRADDQEAQRTDKEPRFVRAIRSAQVGRTDFALSTLEHGLLTRAYAREFGERDGESARRRFHEFRDAHRIAARLVSWTAAQGKGLLLWSGTPPRD